MKIQCLDHAALKISEPRARAVAMLICLALAGACSGGDGSPYEGPERSAPAPRPDDSRRIVELFETRQSGVEVEAVGTVVRALADDLEGSRHQRIIVRLSDGHTVLISHNIDLAPKVPIERGDELRFRGDFEWNDRGGVVHWTHHDPRGRREGGFLELRGQVYR